MSYKNHPWHILGKDYNSPFIRNYIWTKAFFSYPTLLGIPRFVAGITSEKDKINYILDPASWNQCHEELKKKVLADYHFMEQLIAETFRMGESFNKWSEKNMFNANLKALSPKKIVELFNIFIQKQSELYAYGVALPILDIQKYSFVESNLIQFLKSKLPSEEQFKEAYSLFTEPPENSFAQDQEEDLLRLMEEFFDNKVWVHDINSKSAEELKKMHPTFYSQLQQHTQKHAWVYYVYAGPAFTEQNFLEFIRDYLQKGIDPSEKLQEIAERKEQSQKSKKYYLKKLQPDQFHSTILALAGTMVWGKPRRKDYQSKSYYHFEKLLREIANRLSLTLQQARCIPPDSLLTTLTEKEIDRDLLDQIYDYHACLPNDDGTITILVGEEARTFMKFKVQEEKELVKTKTELKGNCACVGKAKGTVRIINIPADMAKMNQGDILVSVATTPAIVPAMKKAAAILTDEGGLTCHAAIVSREMRTPCIVGLKVVTKVFKDGDQVEVDASKGTVKKVK